MKKLILSTLLGSAFTVCMAASVQAAEIGPYIGIVQTSLKIKMPGTTIGTIKVTGTGVNMGYKLNEYMSLEGKYISGTKDTQYLNGSVELDTQIGASVLGKLPIAKTGFSGYGSLGINRTALTSKLIGYVPASDNYSALGYGFGLMYTYDSLNLRAGYEQMYRKDDISIKGLNLAGSLDF